MFSIMLAKMINLKVSFNTSLIIFLFQILCIQIKIIRSFWKLIAFSFSDSKLNWTSLYIAKTSLRKFYKLKIFPSKRKNISSAMRRRNAMERLLRQKTIGRGKEEIMEMEEEIWKRMLPTDKLVLLRKDNKNIHI